MVSENEKLRALLVEDDALSRKVASDLLQKQGYDLEIATTGQETLEKIQNHFFDLIYMDLGLPDAHGLDIVRTIRKNTTNLNAQTTIIGLTAYFDSHVQAECAAAGIQYVLVKPLDVQKVETAEVVMNNHISGRKLDLFLTPKTPVELAVIDLQSALQTASGNVELLKEMLTSFIDTLPEAQKDIEEAFNAQDWQALQQRVHKIHGAAAYCGVPRLRGAANILEGELRKATGDYAEAYQNFVQEAERLTTEYQQKRDVLFNELVNSSLPGHTDSTTPFKGHLLVVEDDPINQVIIRELLESLGFTAATASTGQEGLTMLQAKDVAYDAVIMDVGLPDISGIEVTRRLRASNAPLKNVPIIALTGHVSPQYQAECLNGGMNAFLSKPTTREQLLKSLQQLLGE